MTDETILENKFPDGNVRDTDFEDGTHPEPDPGFTGVTEVNGQVTDGVTQANISVLGQAPAMAMGTIYQSLAHAQGILYANMVTEQASLAASTGA